MPLNAEQIAELDLASQRVAAGSPQAGIAGVNAGDLANIEYATQNYGYSYNPNNAGAMADTIEQTNFQKGTGIEGYDAALAAQNNQQTETGFDTDWMQEWMKNAFGTQNQEGMTVTAPTFEAEKLRLETVRNSRLAALDAQHAVNVAKLQKQNKDVGNSLKARLIKLGVSPSDSSWSNAEAGQLERDRAAEAALQSEYMSNKAKIESDADVALTNIAMNEANMAFNANVKNIETKLATQAQGISLYQLFSQRDQSEKDREQRAYSSLLDYTGKMATLDQAQQEAVAKNVLENAQAGLYNISDKATLEMLAKLEKESPYLTGLTQVATSGLTDRLDQKAQDAANLRKTEADIAQSYASINKMRADAAKGASDDQSKEIKAFFDDAETQLGLLASGKTDWGTAFNTMMNKYEQEQGSEEYKNQINLLDTILNKDLWANKGAYEKQQKIRSTNQPQIIIGAPQGNY